MVREPWEMNRKLGDATSSGRLRVLLVEDDSLLAEELREEMDRHGYAVSHAASFDNAQQAAMSGDVAIVVLDRIVGGVDGLAMVEAMRNQGIATPVMILSSLSSIDERIRGLRAGGDDYLIKPFAMGELMVRIEVLLRRGGDGRATRLRAGPLELDLVEHTVRRSGRLVELYPREFKILEYFMRRPNQAITREALLRDVWNYDSARQTNVVDVYLGTLRRKLDAGGESPLIINVRRTGFVLCVDQKTAEASRRRGVSRAAE
jgi:two-component system, OmpR family, response regulator